jgi:hypothetical protein
MATPDQAFKGWVEYGSGGSGGGGGNAFVQGGNTFGAAGVLGTNDAQPLTFETNAVERARILSGGAVLVGTTVAAGSESLRVAGGGLLVDGTQLVGSVTGSVSLNSSGSAINIGDAANAQAINLGTGAAARAITIGNATAGTTLTARAPTINLVASTAIQVNGSAGSSGQVLTSQGAGSPAIWAPAGSSSPLTLVSTTTAAGVNSFNVTGLNGDADIIYFIEGNLRIFTGAGTPDGQMRLQVNADTGAVYRTSAMGLTFGGAQVNTAANPGNFWLLHHGTYGGGTPGAQILFSIWIQASRSDSFPTSRFMMSGTSALDDLTNSNGVTSTLGGSYISGSPANLTSLTFSNSQAALNLTGKVSVYKLTR